MPESQKPLPDERRVEERRTPDPKGPERRTIAGLFVNKQILKRYGILVAAIMMVSAMLIGFVIHQTIKQSLEKETRRVGKASVYEVLMEVNNELLLRVFFVLFLSVVVTGVTGVLFLHRIAGPLYRIRGVLRNLVQGKVPDRELQLREGDFFAEVVDELNRLIIKMRGEKKSLP